MNQSDSERRSRLLSVKLRTLVRDHLGLQADPEGTPEVFPPGAAFITDDAAWVLIDGDATRSLGAVIAWASRFEKPIHLLVERDSGMLVRRAAMFSVDITVWHVDDRLLLPAVREHHLDSPAAQPAHLAFTDLIAVSGAEPLVEHGVVVGEVRGLEMCRVVDDAYTEQARLEVGMGAHDREAFAMVHGDLPTEKALTQVIDAVLQHRQVGADQHPLNQYGVERFYRWQALQDPASIGFSSLEIIDPPVQRMNLKDAVPCAALGVTTNDEQSVVVFVHGVDIDVVPFAVDAASRMAVDRVAIVARKRDVTPSITKLATMSSIPVTFNFLDA
jgi:hypothetical protein